MESDNQSRSCRKGERTRHSIDDRLIVTPIKHADLWKDYHAIMSTFWRPQEVILETDIIHWRDLSPDLKSSIEKILAFFATSDTLVQINILEHLLAEVKVMEAQFFYSYQSLNENIHAETYAMLLDTLAESPQKREYLVDSIKSAAPIREKLDWILRWLNETSSRRSTLLKVYVFAIVEGIFFCSSFAFIHSVKQLGKLPGLTFSNELISRDERAHYKFAVKIFHFLRADTDDELPQVNTLMQILREATDIETNFASYVMNDTDNFHMNLTRKDMHKYVRFLANGVAIDFKLGELPYPECTQQPLAFMINMDLFGKTNFFEKNVSEYRKFDETNLCLDSSTCKF